MFEFWNYKWECAMEGHRLIHPDYPYMYYEERYVTNISDRSAALSIGPALVDHITYWDGTVYHPSIGGGLIRSVDTFGYGTYSAKIQMPEGSGLWPSFWLCGDGPWPDSGEIDIEEGYSDHKYLRLFTPYFPWFNPSWTTTNNIHYSKDGEHKQAGPRSISIFKQCSDPTKAIIEYKCIWKPDEIRIYANDTEVRRDTKVVQYFPKDIKMHVIINALCEDPAKHKVSIDTSMLVTNFIYQPL